jgi:hypothetical protein
MAAGSHIAVRVTAVMFALPYVVPDYLWLVIVVLLSVQCLLNIEACWSAAVAAADATGSQELLLQQLPLDPCSCSPLQLNIRGLLVTGAPADAAASEVAVAALEQQQPATVQQGQALRLALSKVSVIVVGRPTLLACAIVKQVQWWSWWHRTRAAWSDHFVVLN